MTNSELNSLKSVIGTFFKRHRKSLNITQNSVAELSGIRESTIQRIESGKFIPDGKTMIRLCTAMGLTLVIERGTSLGGFSELMEIKWEYPANYHNIVNNRESIGDAELIDFKNKIGDGFFNFRKEQEISLESLSESIGLGIPTIKSIEEGQFFPDGKSLVKICYGLQIIFYPEERKAESLVVRLP